MWARTRGNNKEWNPLGNGRSADGDAGDAGKEKPQSHSFASTHLGVLFRVLEVTGRSVARFICWDNIQGKPTVVSHTYTLLVLQF